MRKVVSDSPLLAGIEGVEPYQFATSRELYVIEPPPEIITDFLPRSGIMGITSFPGVGKSWLTMEIIRAVSTGTKFLNRMETTQGSCLFVGSDSSVFDYARQWTRIARGTEEEALVHSAEPDEGADENARRESAEQLIYGPDWHLGPFHSCRFLLQSQFMFDSTDEIRRLISTANRFEWGPFENQYDDMDEFTGSVRAIGFDVLIFDTLSRLTRANQNDNTEMEEVFRHIRSVSELTGAACIVLHHNSKQNEYNSGEDWRGAMAQIGALDSWVQLSASKNDKYLIKGKFKKFRGITPDDFTYRMEVDDPERAKLTMAEEAKVGKLYDDVAGFAIEFLQKSAGTKFTMVQIRNGLWEKCADLFGGQKDKFTQALRLRLEANHSDAPSGLPHVKKSGGGQRGVTAYYWIEKEAPSAEATQEVPDEPEAPAPPVGGDAPEPKPRKARKARKKEK